MYHNKLKLKAFCSPALLLLCVTSAHASPVWTFTPDPNNPPNQQVPSNVTATVKYTVTNQSSLPHTLKMTSIDGVTQVTTGTGVCSNPFTLPAQWSSCTLSLQVSAGVSVAGGPEVCGFAGGASAGQCYQPSQANSLNITSTGTPVALGDAYGGGIVACLGGAPYQNLIAATTDDALSPIAWGGFGTNVPTAEDDNDGATNTANIINCLTNSTAGGCPGNIAISTYAAGVCSQYDGGGYTDWFLPAKSQLNCLYTTNQTVPLGFASDWYWSSTEINALEAYRQNYVNGVQLNQWKNSANKVRCVRAF